jgi:hypothetical protein
MVAKVRCKYWAEYFHTLEVSITYASLCGCDAGCGRSYRVDRSTRRAAAIGSSSGRAVALTLHPRKAATERGLSHGGIHHGAALARGRVRAIPSACRQLGPSRFLAAFMGRSRSFARLGLFLRSARRSESRQRHACSCTAPFAEPDARPLHPPHRRRSSSRTAKQPQRRRDGSIAASAEVPKLAARRHRPCRR